MLFPYTNHQLLLHQATRLVRIDHLKKRKPTLHLLLRCCSKHDHWPSLHCPTNGAVCSTPSLGVTQVIL